MSESLEQVIEECIKGKRSAQETLYVMFCNTMMGVCLWYAKNKQEAEEILQDGFMLVFLNIKSFKGEGSFEGWIRKIMVNAALTKYRSKKASRLHSVVELKESYDAIRINNNAITSMYEKELLVMIQTLSPVYRMVFNLYVFEGMKHKEIAQQLGISEGTSKSNLADARAILQRRLAAQQKVKSS